MQPALLHRGLKECHSLLLLLSVHGWDELLDSKVLDELLEDLVLAWLDLVDLDLGLVWNEVHLSFSLFLLESERDASDRSLLNSLHKVGGVSSNLVPKSLGLDDTHVIEDSLVHVEVFGKPVNATNYLIQSQRVRSLGRESGNLLSVVFLDEGSGRSLDGLGSNSSLHTTYTWSARLNTVANSKNVRFD